MFGQNTTHLKVSIIIADACIFQESSMERNYTFYMNGTQVISRHCSPPDILVTCLDDLWSPDPFCEELDITMGTTSGTGTGSSGKINSGNQYFFSLVALNQIQK